MVKANKIAGYYRDLLVLTQNEHIFEGDKINIF